jgi:hypothetical protein
MGGGISAAAPHIKETVEEETTMDRIAALCSKLHSDGSSYQGNYSNGLMHGQGRLVLSSGDVYQGNFIDNEIHGQGRMTFYSLDTAFSSSNCITKMLSDVESSYEGAWEHGQKNGNGKFHFSNGDVYVGMFKDNKEHGRGTKNFVNGNLYVGQWVNGKIGGRGKYFYPDGDEYEFIYDSSGNRIWDSFTFADGEKYEGDFEEESVANWINEEFNTPELRTNARLMFANRTQIY